MTIRGEHLGVALVLILIGLWFGFLSDLIITVPDQTATVVVVDKVLTHPEDGRNNQLVVQWDEKKVLVRCESLRWKMAKSGDTLTVERRKGWLFGMRHEPKVKEY